MIAQSFWHGGELSPYEWLCLKSFLDHGHGYHLYTYDPDLKLPSGAQRRDAAEILAKDRVFTFNSGPGRGSLAIFADLFRYELLLERGGWWVDTDVVCLSEAMPDGELFFANEKPGRVNCAIMRFPPRHPVMLACRDAAALLGADVAWGETGPHLLTRLLIEQGLAGEAASPETCYPFDWTEVPLLYDPAKTEALIERTQCSPMIHLWNEMLRRAGIHKGVGVPEGCYLDRLFHTHNTNFVTIPQYRIEDIVLLDENRLAVDDALKLANQIQEITNRRTIQEDRRKCLKHDLTGASLVGGNEKNSWLKVLTRLRPICNRER